MEDTSDRPLEIPIGKRPLKNDTRLGRSPRDPRFDPRCAGSNDPRHFVRNYAFLDEVRQNELKELKRALRVEKNPERAKDIQSTASRMKNKMEHRSTISLMPGTSSRPKPRNKDHKKRIMVDKFKELKETGKLSKYLERKRKKLIKRDGRRFNGMGQ